MIRINHLSYSYQMPRLAPRPTLSGISFEIKTGELVSVLGRSGCGKTTLVNILGGYLTPDEGELLVNGETVTKPGKNRIVVNQENDLFSWLTVVDNLKLVTKNSAQIKACLKLVGLEEMSQYFPGHLSGGMKKRLSLARALAVRPDFLILDEPFASLDQPIREELQLQLSKIFTLTRKTTLLVTHDLEEAIFLSDRIIVLGGSPGRIVNEFKVNFPHPRHLSIKKTARFASLRSKLKRSYR